MDKNIKIITKAFYLGFLFVVIGLTFNTLKAILVFKESPPEPKFMIQIIICFFITGFLYAIGFYLLNPVFTNKNKFNKGLYISLLIYFSVWFPRFLGITGLDFEGKFNLLTQFKINIYITLITDLVIFIIFGIITAYMLQNKEQKKTFNKKIDKYNIYISVCIGFLLFPILYLVISIIFNKIISIGFLVKKESLLWFYIGSYTPYCVTGAFIPLLYYKTYCYKNNNWIYNGILFSIIFYVCFWLMSILFMLPFGYRFNTVIYYILTSFITLTILVLITAKIFKNSNKSF